ncbi:group I truncated hemoglobin [Micromonospora fluostatini]|uniref:group I truncated hemoglobin n=1 Tax=Micromonospora sp. JCM 30529 TaxID=3421643 RepID=UPI003D170F02
MTATVSEESTPRTPFERIGGAGAVTAAVEAFYDRVLADPALAGYFTGIDMSGQRRHLAAMLTVVLGGPDTYAGRGLAEAHHPLGIPGDHYALVGAHLTATLTGLGVPADVLAHVDAVLAQVRDQVVAPGTGPDA